MINSRSVFTPLSKKRATKVNTPRSLFDVVGLFSRDLADLHHIASASMDLSDHSTKFPSKILYPLDFFPHSNGKHQAMVDEFVGVLETFLGTKRIEFRIADRWDACPPPQANGKSLKEYLAKVRVPLSSRRNCYPRELSAECPPGRVPSGQCAPTTTMALTSFARSTRENMRRKLTKGQLSSSDGLAFLAPAWALTNDPQGNRQVRDEPRVRQPHG